jgi:hypothetical protein
MVHPHNRLRVLKRVCRTELAHSAAALRAVGELIAFGMLEWHSRPWDLQMMFVVWGFVFGGWGFGALGVGGGFQRRHGGRIEGALAWKQPCGLDISWQERATKVRGSRGRHAKPNNQTQP